MKAHVFTEEPVVSVAGAQRMKEEDGNEVREAVGTLPPMPGYGLCIFQGVLYAFRLANSFLYLSVSLYLP